MVFREPLVPWLGWLSITNFLEKGTPKPSCLAPEKDGLPIGYMATGLPDDAFYSTGELRRVRSLHNQNRNIGIIIPTQIAIANPNPTGIHHHLSLLKYRIRGFRLSHIWIAIRRPKMQALIA